MVLWIIVSSVLFHALQVSLITTERGDVRLVGGASHCTGVVEMKHQGVWRPMDAYWGWTSQLSSVVCRQLGCGSDGSGERRYGSTEQPVWWIHPSCKGSESALVECRGRVLDRSSSLTVYLTCSGTRPVPVHGGWTGWSSWSQCSTSCIPEGRASTRTRSRSCTNPAPSSSGNSCVGEANETGLCDHLTSCPALQVSLITTDGDVRLVGGASRCTGRVEMKHQGVWRPVYYSPYWTHQISSVLCRQLGCGSHGSGQGRGGSTDQPARVIYPSCKGSESALVECGGRVGDDSSSLTVYVTCSVHGGWTGWSSWSQCSTSCIPEGRASTRTRSRSCTNPAPPSSGNSCVGDTKETGRCDHLTSCPALQVSLITTERGDVRLVGGASHCTGVVEMKHQGVWRPVRTGWGYPWTPQLSSVLCRQLGCGSDGSVQERRVSTQPAWWIHPSCKGSESALVECRGTVEGGSSSFTLYLTCSGAGPDPVHGGWTGWSSWSQCSTSCIPEGRASTRTRSRSCTNPAPPSSGNSCVGDTKETGRCDHMTSCPVHGGWTGWSSWSQCSTSCIPEGRASTRTRSRSCTNPAPSSSGNSCVGDTKETGRCDHLTSCPVHGGWTGWSSWSQCSTSCIPEGRALTRTRSRSCTNPAPPSSGNNCVGGANETGRCDHLTSCPDGDVRLVGGTSRCAGTLEFKHQGQWRPADSYFDWPLSASSVVCRQLGCGADGSGQWRGGSTLQPVWWIHRFCNGSESAVMDCSGTVGNYTSASTLELICSESVRLVNGTSECSGRVEVKSDQSWLSVCEGDFDQQDAEVVCRQLGCGPPSVLQGALYGEGKAPMWTKEFHCEGSESVLLDCRTSDSTRKTCSLDKTVGLTCSALFSECGRPEPHDDDTKVMGGRRTHPGDHPWQASVQRRPTGSSEPFEHKCGGVLIASCWVLTAAHCIKDSTEMQVVLGGVNIKICEACEQVIPVLKAIVHEDYREFFSNGRRTHVNNDVALLQLNSPRCAMETRYVKTACLPNQLFPDDKECVITGWGVTKQRTIHEPKPKLSDWLLEANVPLISKQSCQEAYNYNLDDTMICAGYMTGEVDSCKGDSGGPLMCKQDGVHYIAGLVSWGRGCAQRDKPGVYANVHRYVDWINKKMSGDDDDDDYVYPDP